MTKDSKAGTDEADARSSVVRSLVLGATLLGALCACSGDPEAGAIAAGSGGAATAGSGGGPSAGNGGALAGGSGGTPATGSAGAGSGLSTAPVPLLFDASGNVLPNSANIQGGWYTYSDGQSGPDSYDGRCEMAGHAPSECSTITPPPGMPVIPAELATGTMCVSGIAARIIHRIVEGAPSPDAGSANDAGTSADAGSPGDAGVPVDPGVPDYGIIIGVIAGFGLHASPNPSYDAIANGVTGFSFDIDTPPSAMGVLVPTSASAAAGAPAAWGGATGGPSPVVAGTNSFRWADVGGPTWLPNPPPFDPTTLVTLLFGVSGDPAFERPFSFCVSNIKALRD